MVEMPQPQLKENHTLSCAFAIAGVMITLVIYGFLQEKIMAGEYGTGDNKEKFTFSIFLVFCNRITTSTISAAVLLATNKSVNPVAPIYKYCGVSITNIISTTCQYEALKFVSFPVQTLAKCAKMIPVMVWGTVIMQKRYYVKDYSLAVFVTLGCSLFILHQPMINTEKSKRESTVRGVSLMLGYLGFDGFTSTFQDKLFKGYEMEIQNQIFFTTTCSCFISLCWLIFHGKLIPAIDFMFRHPDCFFDATVLSCVATASQFFISYTIRHFGALTFAIVMTTKQLVSIVLSCIYFSHPLDRWQWLGGAIVFGSLYTKNLLRNKPQGLPTNAQ